MVNTRNKKNGSVLTPDALREILRARGIADSLSAFARDSRCSRQAIYFALENPKRFPLVYRRITTAIE